MRRPESDACGSHAFLIWFQDEELLAMSPVEQVLQVMAGLSWSEVAEDWDA